MRFTLHLLLIVINYWSYFCLIEFADAYVGRTSLPTGKVYFLFDQSHAVTFTEAVKACVQPEQWRQRSDCGLATFKSYAKQRDLLKEHKKHMDYATAWFGAVMLGNTSLAVYLNGSDVIKENPSVWDTNEPNDHQAQCRGVLVTKSDIKWRDAPCNERHAYICECGQSTETDSKLYKEIHFANGLTELLPIDETSLDVSWILWNLIVFVAVITTAGLFIFVVLERELVLEKILNIIS